MISYFLSKVISMCMGLLYPAYCSYKAVKTKNVKEYVHWMMYWIVFSIFSFFEVFVDSFLGFWFPFYYEIKIVFILWMLSPTTRGGSVLYRRIIHPLFTRHENEIDEYLADFKLHASNLIVRWGASAFNYFTETVMSAVLRIGCDYGFFNQNRRSFSLDGYDEQDMNRNIQVQHHHPIINQREEACYPEMDITTSNLDEGIPRQRRSVDRNVSVERDNMNRHNGLPKPVSMMNLGMDEGDQAPPKVRSSSRKKKEFGNYTVVTSQDMAMPLMFGWYPSPNVAPELSTTASVYIHQPPMLPSSFMTPLSIESPVEVASSEHTDSFFTNDDDYIEESDEFDDDLLDSETDNFFDCEIDDSEDEQTISEIDSLSRRSQSSASGILSSSVQRVSKKSLQTFPTAEDNKGPAPVAQRRMPRSKEKDVKRNSMSSLQGKSGLVGGGGSSSSVSDSKSKVKKSLSNSDLKLVKPTSIWSTSPFRRVLGPFASSSSPQKSPSATNLKRSGSNTSRASLNLEKKRKSESKVDN